MDLWIAVDPDNAQRISIALQQFGFASGTVPAEMFLEKGRIFRFGVKPVRIELLTSPSGIDFEPCYARRIEEIDGILVPLVARQGLRQNKRAAGLLKDQDDLLNLPSA